MDWGKDVTDYRIEGKTELKIEFADPNYTIFIDVQGLVSFSAFNPSVRSHPIPVAKSLPRRVNSLPS